MAQNKSFQALAKNLEQPEIKDWLASTKDMLMSEKSGKDQDSEAKKLNEILKKFVKHFAMLLVYHL